MFLRGGLLLCSGAASAPFDLFAVLGIGSAFSISSTVLDLYVFGPFGLVSCYSSYVVVVVSCGKFLSRS